MVDKTVIDDRLRCKEVAKTSITQTWSHLILWQECQSKLYTDRNWMIANSHTTTITSHIGNVVALHRDTALFANDFKEVTLIHSGFKSASTRYGPATFAITGKYLLSLKKKEDTSKKNTTSLLVSCLDRETIEVKVTIVRSLCLLRIACW